MVLGLKFQLLIHFEISVYGRRYESNFIPVLHVNICVILKKTEDNRHARLKALLNTKIKHLQKPCCVSWRTITDQKI